MNPRIQTVINLMETHLQQPLVLEDLAHAVNLSASRLSRLFKAETGEAPGQYLRALRLQRAAELLANSFLQVQEVTARVGWQDESHFYRAFKQVYGLTPLAYRERHFRAPPLEKSRWQNPPPDSTIRQLRGGDARC